MTDATFVEGFRQLCHGINAANASDELLAVSARLTFQAMMIDMAASNPNDLAFAVPANVSALQAAGYEIGDQLAPQAHLVGRCGAEP